jgi:hypothetical protein
LGTKSFIFTTCYGSVFGIVVAATPCFLFNTIWIWRDWWIQIEKLKKMNTIFFYPISLGNFSTPLMLSKQFNISPSYSMLMVSLFIILSIALALTAPFSDKRENIPKRVQNRIFGVLQHPFLCVSIGVIVTLAISPLLWIHYLVVLLLPALWMILEKRVGEIVGVLATISIIMASGLLLRILTLHSTIWLSKAPYMFGLAWVPLWAATLIIVKRVDSNRIEHTPAPIKTD